MSLLVAFTFTLYYVELFYFARLVQNYQNLIYFELKQISLFCKKHNLNEKYLVSIIE